MTIRESGERARLRYATVLYWSALLRDPSPSCAARTVVAAFRSMTSPGPKI
ncbi:MAG: hypothetical protein H0X37_25885 [Herpetosiphonaceae bacterium]|nr:hypothetical protein [Herpetosiphonaceae bacterium]